MNPCEPATSSTWALPTLTGWPSRPMVRMVRVAFGASRTNPTRVLGRVPVAGSVAPSAPVYRFAPRPATFTVTGTVAPPCAGTVTVAGAVTVPAGTAAPEAVVRPTVRVRVTGW